jgi:hypothetical protein
VVDSDRTEILTGASRGERVVVNPPPALTDGGRVDVATWPATGTT